MNDDIKPIPAPISDDPAACSRLFLREPGWQIAVKSDAERAFCHNMNPGEEFYHRLQQAEVYLFHGSERVCLACAERRGLIAREPKRLRDSLWSQVGQESGIMAGTSGSIEMDDVYA